MEGDLHSRIVVPGIGDSERVDKNEIIINTLNTLREEERNEIQQYPFANIVSGIGTLQLFENHPHFQMHYHQLLHHFSGNKSNDMLRQNVIYLAGGLYQDIAHLVCSSRQFVEGNVVLSPGRTIELQRLINPNANLILGDYWTEALDDKATNFDGAMVSASVQSDINIPEIYEYTASRRKRAARNNIQKLELCKSTYPEYFQNTKLIMVVPEDYFPYSLTKFDKNTYEYEYLPFSGDEFSDFIEYFLYDYRSEEPGALSAIELLMSERKKIGSSEPIPDFTAESRKYYE